MTLPPYRFNTSRKKINVNGKLCHSASGIYQVNSCKPDDNMMISFDVVALYPSVPRDQALKLFEEQLINDEKLPDQDPDSS